MYHFFLAKVPPVPSIEWPDLAQKPKVRFCMHRNSGAATPNSTACVNVKELTSAAIPKKREACRTFQDFSITPNTPNTSN